MGELNPPTREQNYGAGEVCSPAKKLNSPAGELNSLTGEQNYGAGEVDFLTEKLNQAGGELDSPVIGQNSSSRNSKYAPDHSIPIRINTQLLLLPPLNRMRFVATIG